MNTTWFSAGIYLYAGPAPTQQNVRLRIDQRPDIVDYLLNPEPPG
jgi:hypothetical protein